MHKTLCTTTDFVDDLIPLGVRGIWFTPDNLDQMMASIWTTRLERGESFVKYKGSAVFKETTEYRTLLPYEEGGCRVLEFAGLDLPEGTDCYRVQLRWTDVPSDGYGVFQAPGMYPRPRLYAVRLPWRMLLRVTR